MKKIFLMLVLLAGFNCTLVFASETYYHDDDYIGKMLIVNDYDCAMPFDYISSNDIYAYLKGVGLFLENSQEVDFESLSLDSQVELIYELSCLVNQLQLVIIENNQMLLDNNIITKEQFDEFVKLSGKKVEKLKLSDEMQTNEKYDYRIDLIFEYYNLLVNNYKVSNKIIKLYYDSVKES